MATAPTSNSQSFPDLLMEVCLEACDQRPDVLREVLFGPDPAGKAHDMAAAGMPSSVHQPPGAQQTDTVDLRALGASESQA